MTAIDLTGTPAEIDAIIALAKRSADVEGVSEPSNLDASRALNTGFPGLGPEAVLVFLTIAFKTGTAALQFFKALREELKARHATVAASESATGKLLGRIESTTSDQKLEEIALS